MRPGDFYIMVLLELSKDFDIIGHNVILLQQFDDLGVFGCSIISVGSPPKSDFERFLFSYTAQSKRAQFFLPYCSISVLSSCRSYQEIWN